MKIENKKETRLAPPLNPERIVKPRKLYNPDPKFICWDSYSKTVLYDDAPSVSQEQGWDLLELCKWLWEANSWPRKGNKRLPILLVCRNPQEAFLQLHTHFADDPNWNCNLKHQDTEVYGRDGKLHKPKIKTSKNDHIGFMGFRYNKENRYLWPISPLDFIEDFDRYYPDVSEIERLYTFALDLRQFIVKNRLRFSTTRGGVAAQLLRDGRFYPDPRRKVPMKTNEKARRALPGNYVRSKRTTHNTRVKGKIFEIDQENSHHYCAENINLPDANTLFAHGRFLTESDEPYVRAGHWYFDELMKQHGLFRVGVLIPKYLNGYLPSWAQPTHSTVRNVFLYSNEIPLAKKLGIDIRYISYCFTSPDTDSGLPKFAQWAQEQIVESKPNRKIWLKPMLLSTYGLLGTRPRKHEVAFHRTESEKAEPETYWIGPVPVTLQKLVTKRELQPSFANVVQRGMIEAETRKLSVEKARELEYDGHDVIAIHSDALHILDEGQLLPLLEPPWRLKRTLTNYVRLDNVSYESDEAVCTPGRTHRDKEKRQKRRAKTLR